MKSWRKGAGIDVILEEAEGNEGLEERGLEK
jgi:hypothetical protein